MWWQILTGCFEITTLLYILYYIYIYRQYIESLCYIPETSVILPQKKMEDFWVGKSNYTKSKISLTHEKKKNPVVTLL